MPELTGLTVWTTDSFFEILAHLCLGTYINVQIRAVLIDTYPLQKPGAMGSISWRNSVIESAFRIVAFALEEKFACSDL